MSLARRWTRRAFIATAATAVGLIGLKRHAGNADNASAFDFSSAADAPTWGEDWFSTHYKRRQGVEHGIAFLTLPEGLPTTAPDQPVPIFQLDHDCRAFELRLVFAVDNATLRPGLLFAGRGAHDYLAATVEGDQLVLSQFGRTSRRTLAKAPIHAMRAKALQDLRLSLRGTKLEATLIESGRTRVQQLVHEFETAPIGGAVGILAVAPTNLSAATLEVSRYEVHSERLSATPPLATYLISGPPFLEADERLVRLRVGTSIPCDIRFEWAKDRTFADARSSNWISAAAPPFTATTQIAVNESAPTYWRAQLRSTSSRKTTMTPDQTIPAPPTGAPLTLLAGSCVEFDYGRPTYGYRRLLAASATPPAMMVYQGDLGYANNRYHSCYAAAEDFFADRFIRFLADPLFAELRRTVPTGFTLDDHDYGPRNNADRTDAAPWVPPLWQRLGADPTSQGYYDVVLDDVHCFTLDGRRYADPITTENSPAKTKLGLRQRDWLGQTMASSPASLFVIFSADIFASRYTVPGSTNIPDCFSSGWPDEYRYLMALFYRYQLGGKRVLILSGDAHSLRVHYHPRPDGQASHDPVVEFICSGLRPRRWSGAATGDPTVDPRRNVIGKAGAGLLAIAAARAENRIVTLRAISGEANGATDLFPPLTLPFRPRR